MCTPDCSGSFVHCILGGWGVPQPLRQVFGVGCWTPHTQSLCIHTTLSLSFVSLPKQLNDCLCIVSLPAACSLKAVQKKKKRLRVDCCLQIKPQICSGEAMGEAMEQSMARVDSPAGPAGDGWAGSWGSSIKAPSLGTRF